MTIKEAVTQSLQKRNMNIQCDEYHQIAKSLNTEICWEVYKIVVQSSAKTGQELMKLIDDEVESRGYDVYPTIQPHTNFKPKIQANWEQEYRKLMAQYTSLLTIAVKFVDAYQRWNSDD